MNETTALKLARRLLDDHGLNKWKVELDHAVRRFGCCHYHTRRITLSAPLIKLNRTSDVRDTILHEIAHALVGWQSGHGAKWKAMAARIGARPRACYSDTVAEPPPKYIFRCLKCHRTSESNRKPWRATACWTCCDRYAGGRFDKRFALVGVDQKGNRIEYECDNRAQWIAKYTCSLCGYLLSRRRCTNRHCKNRGLFVVNNSKGAQHQ
jgi:predicted SprT family Zn-dependent metalloprotease